MNEKIRQLAKKKRIALWEIAAKIGISEATITRWMRVQLSAEKESLILNGIHEIAAEREAEQ